MSTPRTALIENIPDQTINSEIPLRKAVRARKADYTHPRRIRIKIGSWNVGAGDHVEKDLEKWLKPSNDTDKILYSVESHHGEDIVTSVEAPKQAHASSGSILDEQDGQIDLYVLGLQEIVDVTSPAETLLRNYADPKASLRWKNETQKALPQGYTLVADQQLVGLLILIYASPNLEPEISSVSTSFVGTGIGNNITGYLGNKGGVAVRLVLGESTKLVFIDSHLAAGADKAALDRRNWDAQWINGKLGFEPVIEPGEIRHGTRERLGEEDFAWWFGDLNYRLEDIPDADVRRLLNIYAPKEESKDQDTQKESSLIESTLAKKQDELDTSQHTNPVTASVISAAEMASKQAPETAVQPETEEDAGLASLHMTLSSLLAHDSLRRQQALRKVFHDGWSEGNITFLPTYKYDIGSIGVFDSSEKHRSPSWCDRILYRSRKARLAFEQTIQNELATQKRDAELKASGADRASEEEDVLFSYDPEMDGTDAHEYDEDEDVDPKLSEVNTEAPEKIELLDDDIILETYTSHQKISSSDHKPLTAVFSIEYDSIDHEAKTRIQQEVARDLDRAENEARPSVTLVTDQDIHHGIVEGQMNFGPVRYRESKRGTATVGNIGRVPAVVSFISRPSATSFGSEYSHNWLKVGFEKLDEDGESDHISSDTKEITLEPGEAVTISVELYIDDLTWVKTFNENPDLLEDVLVLGIKHGRDWFIPIKGQWLPSCLCRSLNELLTLEDGGIRARSVPVKSTPEAINSLQIKRSVPKEIYRLVEAISQRIEREVADLTMRSPTFASRRSGELAHEEVSMIDLETRPPWEQSPGWPFASSSRTGANSTEWDSQLVLIREAIETDTDFQSDDKVSALIQIEAFAASLLEILSTLTDGIITKDLWELIEQEMLSREKLKSKLSDEEEKDLILDILSTNAPTHNICFVFLTSMLGLMIAELAPLGKSPDGQNIVTLQARRDLVEKGYAIVFVEGLIKANSSNEKKKAASFTRKLRLLELFLQGTRRRQ
jgi:phosphatidylinositol-bisphosphatase